MGFETYWSCNSENLASMMMARKLGYRTEVGYELVEYPALRTSKTVEASTTNYTP